MLGRDFQRNLEPYEIERLTESRAIKVWSGELAVEQTLNTEVTTAFPVDQAVGDMAPGVYVMTADVKGNTTDTDDSISTQWFIVSDMGLSAYSGSDGINVFVNSLATHRAEGPDRSAADVARQRGARHQAQRRRRAACSSRRAFPAARARCRPPCWSPPTRSGDYGFLNLKGPAFDLSDRGVAGRPPVAGLDAFVYTERGVYRSGETVHITSLLRDPQGVAAAGVPLTLVVERPDGLEYRRTRCADQGVGGYSLSVPISSAASTGTWRVRAFTDPKRPAVGETTFLVEDYVPDRLEFDLAAPARADRPRHADQADGRRPLSLRRAGLRASISKARS